MLARTLHSRARARASRRERVVAALVVVMLACPSMVQGQAIAPVDFYHDFRKPPLPAELSLFNDPEGKYCRFEPEGLHITVPKTSIHPSGGVGVRALLELRGDFEVTATIEVLHLEQPPSGSGAGVALYLPTETGNNGAFLGRLLDSKGKQIIMCSRQVPVPGTKGLTWQQHPRPCDDSLLRMRLKRTGTTLSYYFAPGINVSEFHEAHQSDFSADDIKRVRFTAANNQTPCAMDVRLIDLRIRSLLPERDTPAAAAGLAVPQRRWALIVVLAGLGVVLLMGALFYLWKPRAAAPVVEE